MGIDINQLSPAAQKQIMEKLGKQSQKETIVTKYHNQKVTLTLPNGKTHTFDSRKEARRFKQLMMLLRGGHIRNLKLQKQYTLQESYVTPEGERIRAIRYVCDFEYEVHKLYGWELVVEDVKSRPTRTPQYNMKKKLMQERLGLTITEV